jgi:hypothetical protein
MLKSAARSGLANVKLEDQFSDWIAKYQIWDIDSNAADPREEHQFDLDRNDILNQIRQFEAYVRRSKTGKAAKHMSALEFRYALPFPVSISDTLDTFSVLLTVFHRPCGIRPGLGQSLGWLRLPLPLEEIADRDRLTGPKAEEAQSPDAIYGIKMSPSYSLRIHSKDRSVLYQQMVTLSTNANLSSTSAIAVFRLHRSENTCLYHLQGLLKEGNGQTSFRFCTFHPVLPLVLFYRRSFTSGTMIQLWSYNLSEHDEHYLRDALPLSSVRPSGIDHLSFSSCGTQIIVKYSGESYPESHALTQHPSFLHASGQLQQTNLAGQKRNRCDNGLDGRDTPEEVGALVLWANSGTISQTPTFAQNSSRTLYKAKRPCREVSILHRSKGGEVEQPLTQLPRWPGIEEIDINVHTPSNHDPNNVKIVLNKTPGNFLTFDDPLDTHLPAVVTKDVRALAAPVKRTTQHQLRITPRSMNDTLDDNVIT